jgi:hypothetical protein
MQQLIFATILVAFATAAETFIPANDSRVQWVGRTQRNANGTISFDWEGVSAYLTLQQTSYVKLVAYTETRTKLVTIETNSSEVINGVKASNNYVISIQYVDVITGPAVNNTYYVATGLDNTQTYIIRVFNDLEPQFHGLVGQGYGQGLTTFVGFLIDGELMTPAPRPTRRLEWVGDSLTAGFGSMGTSGPSIPCPANQYTTSNYFSYSRIIGDHFNADSSIIAYSGKGMYENCCDNGETMPGYFKQTTVAPPASPWDYVWAPDALLINLGTNDFGKYNGTQVWLTAFEDTYINFVTDVVFDYYSTPSLPVFLVQGPFNNTLLYSSLMSIQASLVAAGVKVTYLSVMTEGDVSGCQGHPSQVDHAAMANLAIPAIQSVMGW